MPTYNIVVGSGLIASALADIDFGRPVLILASGVSDSRENRIEAFEREFDIVEQYISKYPEVHALYCSTCSVDSDLISPYTVHKLNMEALVMGAATSCHIFRLPQIVGLVNNCTLVSHFVRSIMSDEILKIHSRAYRNLLDVLDFARVAKLLVRTNAGAGEPQNIASSNQVPVDKIAAEIAHLLGRSPRLELIDAGYSQEIEIYFLRKHLSIDDRLFESDYWKRVLRKYVPLLAEKMRSEQ